MTLLEETIEFLGNCNLTSLDVEYVVNEQFYCTWDEFVELANINYDSGFGGNEVSMGLMIIGKSWWLERHEYDGSEWWEYKTMPKKPEFHDKDKVCVWDKYGDVYKNYMRKRNNHE